MQSGVIRTFIFYLWILLTINFNPRRTDAFTFDTHIHCNFRIRSESRLQRINHLSTREPQSQPNKLLVFHRNFAMKAQEQSSELLSSSDKVFSKIGKSTSKVVAGTFFVILASQRDCFMLTFFIGSILNGITSKILKRLLNQDRPPGYEYDASINLKPSDKGMPSSHAMSLGFIGIYTAIALCSGLLIDAGTGAKIATCVGLITYVSISLIYRVQSQLHTTAQVLVGLTFGTFNGLFWYSLAHGSNPFFPTFNAMDAVASTLLPESGIMPVQFLIFPLLVGAAVVGSVERRISMLLKKGKKNE